MQNFDIFRRESRNNRSAFVEGTPICIKKKSAGRNFASCARPVSRALCITSLAPIIGQHHLGEGVKQLGGVFFTTAWAEWVRKV